MLAAGLACVGRNVFEHGLLCGMSGFVDDALAQGDAPLIMENAQLHSDIGCLRAHLVIQKGEAGAELIIAAFDASRDGIAARAEEQSRRSKQVFTDMSAGLSNTADAMRRDIREEINHNPDQSQATAIHRLWRCEGLAQEFALRAKRLAGATVIDLE